MSVRQVQVRGCIPTLIALAVVGAILALAVTASFALLAVAAGAGLLAAIVRRALGAAKPTNEETPEARRRAADVTIDAELIEPPEGGEHRPPKRLE
jgi:membrane protein implicated in regulation of membrane protease activity